VSPNGHVLVVVGRVKLPGDTPRFITLDPTEAFLLVGLQNSGLVCTYRIEQSTGMLCSVSAASLSATSAGAAVAGACDCATVEPALAEVPYPTCMVFVKRQVQ